MSPEVIGWEKRRGLGGKGAAKEEVCARQGQDYLGWVGG